MKADRSFLPKALIFLAALGLAAGCVGPPRRAAPDIEPTPVGGAQSLPNLEATSVVGTSMANSTLAAQPSSPVATSTPLAATPIPTQTPLASTATPTNTPAPALPTASPTSQAGTTTYVVQRSDNLYRIALRYGTTVEAIASANGIANPALISVGQVLTIPSSSAQPGPQPGETIYVVQRGDNLYRIALRYGLSYFHLAQYNGIANPARIYAGQTLRIPQE
jgi:LysM repeat protein